MRAARRWTYSSSLRGGWRRRYYSIFRPSHRPREISWPRYLLPIRVESGQARANDVGKARCGGLLKTRSAGSATLGRCTVEVCTRRKAALQSSHVDNVQGAL